MSLAEIEAYLSLKHLKLDAEIEDEIELIRCDAIVVQDEVTANHCWCLGQIFSIQQRYLAAFFSLKAGKYEDAWYLFDQVEVSLGALESNFNTCINNDRYHMMLIGDITKEYQKLFPYRLFSSREVIIKGEECSICGKSLSIRHPCGHRIGKLYMGELCCSVVTDLEFKAVAIVSDPFDKYAILKIEGQDYSYDVLEELMPKINNPFDAFRVETIRIKMPEYEGVGRNERCPCGSGKKYKKCHMGRGSELMDHHIVHFF